MSAANENPNPPNLLTWDIPPDPGVCTPPTPKSTQAILSKYPESWYQLAMVPHPTKLSLGFDGDRVTQGANQQETDIVCSPEFEDLKVAQGHTHTPLVRFLFAELANRVVNRMLHKLQTAGPAVKQSLMTYLGDEGAEGDGAVISLSTPQLFLQYGGLQGGPKGPAQALDFSAEGVITLAASAVVYRGSKDLTYGEVRKIHESQGGWNIQIGLTNSPREEFGIDLEPFSWVEWDLCRLICGAYFYRRLQQAKAGEAL